MRMAAASKGGAEQTELEETRFQAGSLAASNDPAIFLIGLVQDGTIHGCEVLGPEAQRSPEPTTEPAVGPTAERAAELPGRVNGGRFAGSNDHTDRDWPVDRKKSKAIGIDDLPL